MNLIELPEDAQHLNPLLSLGSPTVRNLMEGFISLFYRRPPHSLKVRVEPGDGCSADHKLHWGSEKVWRGAGTENSFLTLVTTSGSQEQQSWCQCLVVTALVSSPVGTWSPLIPACLTSLILYGPGSFVHYLLTSITEPLFCQSNPNWFRAFAGKDPN